jgi:hypothetical protein
VLVEQRRQLADGHAVPHRNRKLADERLEPRLEHRAFDVDAADRIRPVAHDDGQAMRARGAQAVGHRVDVRVDARADVLQIDDERVEAGQHLCRRLARLAVERVDRNLPPRVACVVGLDHVLLHVRSESVLRTEDRPDRDAAPLGTIDRVLEFRVDGRRVDDEADGAAFEELAIEEDV